MRSRCRRCQDWRCDASPGVGHYLGDSDALNRVWGEEPLQEVLAGVAGAARRLVLPRHNAGKELLQALQVVAAVVTPLCKGQHRCTGRRQSSIASTFLTSRQVDWGPRLYGRTGSPTSYRTADSSGSSSMLCTQAALTTRRRAQCRVSSVARGCLCKAQRLKLHEAAIHTSCTPPKV